MYSGIALGVILFAILIIAIARSNPKNTKSANSTENIIGMVWVFTLFFGVPALCCYTSGLPSPDSAKYEVTIEGQRIIFDNYRLSDDEIIIPSHYYSRHSWINSWEYSETPLTIVVPDGNSKPLIGERYIVSRCGEIQTSYPKPSAPYISSGAVDK